MRHSLQHGDDDLVQMLQVVTAQVQLAQARQRPPRRQEEQVVLVQSRVLEVHVDQALLAHRVQNHAQTIAKVAVAEIQPSKQRQSLHTQIILYILFVNFSGGARNIEVWGL